MICTMINDVLLLLITPMVVTTYQGRRHIHVTTFHAVLSLRKSVPSDRLQHLVVPVTLLLEMYSINTMLAVAHSRVLDAQAVHVNKYKLSNKIDKIPVDAFLENIVWQSLLPCNINQLMQYFVLYISIKKDPSTKTCNFK